VNYPEGQQFAGYPDVLGGDLSQEGGQKYCWDVRGVPGIPPLVDNTYPSGISIRDNHLAGAENTCISF